MRRGSRREDARRGARITTAPAAIIVAGGSGERARRRAASAGRQNHIGRNGHPKQFFVLAGKPVISWSIEMLREGGCDPVIVVLPPERLSSAADLVGSSHVAFVGGGTTRQDSVWNGLQAIASDSVVVHDGVRPFASQPLLQRVLDALEGADAVVPALAVHDTLKRVADGVVSDTPDRTRYRRIQTPQAFKTDVLISAHERGQREGFVATDDAHLVERAGGRVVTVEGEYRNLKLTYPEDFLIAETFAGAAP